MNPTKINQLCRLKIEELLDKSFSIIAQDESIEHLDKKYPKDLPDCIIAEFRDYLQSILVSENVNCPNLDSFLNAHIFSLTSAQKFKEEIEFYYNKAHEITLFEKLTNTNKYDVQKYKYALYKYTETMLYSMKNDFVFDLPE